MKKLLTAKEMAHRLGTSPEVLAVQRCRKGPDMLPYLKHGRSVRYDPDVVEEWLKRQRRKS
jgi:hypothetical protein